MWPYCLMVGVPCAIAAAEYAFHRKNSNKAIITSFFLIFLILQMLRSVTVGIDLRNYLWIFNAAKADTWSYGLTHMFRLDYEAGYYLLTKVITSLFSDFQWMLVITALIAVIPVWYLYRDSIDDHMFLAIVLFLNIGIFSIYFSALRQVIAMAFAVPAYYFTKNKKPLLFLLMIVPAYLFHKSAFIIVLMYPIYHFRLRWYQTMIVSALIIPTVFVFRQQIFLFLGKVFSSIYEAQEITMTNAISIFLMLVGFAVFCFVIPDNSLLDDDTIGLRNLLILACILQIFSGVDMLAMRMNYYYLLFVPITITRVIDYTSPKNKKITEVALITMIAFFTIYYFYSAFAGSDSLNIYPYKAFWSPK